jgi:hypothetical protein
MSQGRLPVAFLHQRKTQHLIHARLILARQTGGQRFFGGRLRPRILFAVEGHQRLGDFQGWISGRQSLSLVLIPPGQASLTQTLIEVRQRQKRLYVAGPHRRLGLQFLQGRQRL